MHKPISLARATALASTAATMRGSAVLAAAFLSLPGIAMAFDLSPHNTPSSTLVPGYYACRSGLDFDNFTSQFDVGDGGSYTLRGQTGAGQIVMSPGGAIEFDGGPFMSDDTATTYAANTTRLSDGNAVIIIRYDFGSIVTDDYCALVL